MSRSIEAQRGLCETVGVIWSCLLLSVDGDIEKRFHRDYYSCQIKLKSGFSLVLGQIDTYFSTVHRTGNG